jgi:Asp-tRNA(Asn)/Glu-tRNA(Gln) amidotransferase A subunit family amidase
VIRPAAYCGVVGFKPTQGLLPIEGALTFSHTLDQPGLFTRSAADAAYLASALIGEAAHRCSFETAPPDAPPRLAAVRTPVWNQAEEPARQAFEGQIQTLRRAGATVEEVELPSPFDLAHQAIRVIMAVEAAVNLEPLLLRADAALSETLRSFMDEGRQTGAVVYLKALNLRLALKEELERFLSGYDALITPPTTGEAPDTLAQTGNPCFCSIWSLCGVPAVTIPAGLGPRGLPLGLQIAGRRGRDGAVLSVARWCEGVFPFSPWRGGQR